MADEIKTVEEKSEESGGEIIAAETQPAKRLVKFAKPYNFERTEYTELDLSGLDSLTIQDAIDTQKRMIESGEAAAMQLCENTTVFACTLAAQTTKLPIEFFKLMPRQMMGQVRAEVRKATNGNVKCTGSIMQFESPYEFNGKVHFQVNLCGVADINALQESAAENTLTLEGFPVLENSFNFLYACIIAGMGTKMPTEFFTGLPLCELGKLKKAVNNGGFFE